MLRTANPSEATEEQFTGQGLQAETGLYDYEARWYDPAAGRFLSPDPILPDPFDPQLVNAYSYVRNSPASFVDPTGLVLEPFPALSALGASDHYRAQISTGEDVGFVTPGFYGTIVGGAQGVNPVSDLGANPAATRVDAAASAVRDSGLAGQSEFNRAVASEVADADAKSFEVASLVERDDCVQTDGGCFKIGYGPSFSGAGARVIRYFDSTSKLSLRGKSLISGARKLRELGLRERITSTGRHEFVDKLGRVRAAWDRAKKFGNHWHKFAPDGKTPLNNAGRVVEKIERGAHIPSR